MNMRWQWTESVTDMMQKGCSAWVDAWMQAPLPKPSYLPLLADTNFGV